MKYSPMLAGAVAAASLLSITACGSSSLSATQGAQVAGSSRVPVAREYWSILRAIYGEIDTSMVGGRGFFNVCQTTSGQPAQQVAYNVSVYLAARNQQLPTERFISQLKQTLQSQGWHAFTSGDGYLISSKGIYHVSLRQQAGNQSYLVSLTLEGPCVSVGADFASAVPGLSLNDDYPNSEVSAEPVPTAPLPSP